MVTICNVCEYFIRMGMDYSCGSLDAPISDFILGKRFCSKINTDGQCKNFKEKETVSLEKELTGDYEVEYT